MSRIHNFSAGPAILPESVLRRAQQAIWDFDGTGVGLLEMSHRSATYDRVITEARERLHRLLGCDDDQEVLFMTGGASTQFYLVAANFLGGGRASYLDTGRWSAKAIKEARRYGTADVPWSSADGGYKAVPRDGDWGELPPDTRYLHYTSNNTVAGTQYDYVPTVPAGVHLVCDMSSDILSRPVQASKYGLIYAGAQKNLGPAGVTIVVVRKSWLARANTELATLQRYATFVEGQSMSNTPPTFPIYVVGEVAKWIEDEGGVQAIAERNTAQADKVYGTVDELDRYQGLTERGSRSQMSATFTTGDADLDKAFVAEATAAGLNGLKGHRSVGGLRASLYNAQTDAAVDALVDFMRDFASRNG